MSVQSKRATLDDVTMDRISGLPKSILGKILERLPLRDAVRTSILSTGWRNNWSAAQQLVVDEEFVFGPGNVRMRSPIIFAKAIDEVLLLHNHPVLKFVLYVPAFLKEYQDIDRWMLFLSRNGIKELSLDNSAKNRLDSSHIPHKLPSYLFSCVNLTHLKLSNFTVKPPPTFNGFPNLKSLEINLIVFQTNKDAQTLISNSSSLERLIISNCEGVGPLSICAPRLKVFHVQYQSNRIIFFRFCGSSVLNSSQKLIPNFLTFLNVLPRLEKLILPGLYFKELPTEDFHNIMPVTVDTLKYVRLIDFDFGDLHQVSSCIFLIRSSPNLKELEVSSLAFSLKREYGEVLAFMKSLKCEDSMLHQLQVVRMPSANGRTMELEFIKYLLASSPKLKKIFIEKNCLTTDEYSSLAMSSTLLRFSRASPKAEIIFNPQN